MWSWRAPTTASTHCGTSVAHSPIATNERAPPTTAAAAIARIVCTWWRIPRGCRGSGTAAKRASRSRHDCSVNGGQGVTD